MKAIVVKGGGEAPEMKPTANIMLTDKNALKGLKLGSSVSAHVRGKVSSASVHDDCAHVGLDVENVSFSSSPEKGDNMANDNSRARHKMRVAKEEEPEEQTYVDEDEA